MDQQEGIKTSRVLVTGGTGFLGKALVKRLLVTGYVVRVLARPSSNIDALKSLDLEIAFGDVTDLESFGAAVEGTDVIVHTAASEMISPIVEESATVLGTRNVLELAKKFRIKKLIYISSCSVYALPSKGSNDTLNEESPLEDRPWLRGAYTLSKVQAEAMVRAAIGNSSYTIIVLRPGTIYGPGGELFPAIMGASWRGSIFLVIGNGKFELPLVYIDNVVDAIIQSIASPRADNQVFNVVDPDRVTKRQFVDIVVKGVNANSKVLYLPYCLVRVGVGIVELACKLLGQRPFMTMYRLVASQTQVRYDSTKLRKALSFQPRVSFPEAAAMIVDHLRDSDHPGGNFITTPR